MNRSVLKLPSAILPVAMSLAALIVVLVHLALADAAPQAGESTAQAFQLLLAGQAPVVAFFAIKWLPRLPGEALMMMGVQAGAAMLALAPVVFLDL